jgi:hypothetical protein
MRPATPETVAAEIKKALAPGEVATTWRLIAETDVPTDRRYRGAWSDPGAGPLVHDMASARAIHREHLRQARTPQLVALDVAYQRADERGDKSEQARIVATKQRLRDLPADPAIDAAQTMDGLRAAWPRDWER